MAELVTKRHPIRAALWGFVAGLGVLVALIFVWPVIGIDSASSVAIKSGIVVGGVMVLAVVFAMLIPPKKPKGPPPDASPGTETLEPAQAGSSDEAAPPAASAADEPQSDQGSPT